MFWVKTFCGKNLSGLRNGNQKMREDNKVIKGLWIGNELSPNEILSINSYLHHNHVFELYVYDRIKNVPDRVVIKDAEQIVPRAEIFSYTGGHHKKSYSMFSDYFRYKLLFELGGWWSDLDAVCLKPYDLNQDYVFMQEKQKRADDRVCGGVLKTPKGSPLMMHCYEITRDMSTNIDQQLWAATGPDLLGRAVKEFKLDDYVVPSRYFSPIGFFELSKLFTPLEIVQDSYSVHLYNEIWSMHDFSKYGVYPKKSLFENLKRQYSVRNNHWKLIPEFLNDLKNLGLNRGSKTIYGKLAHMLKPFLVDKRCP